MDAKEYIEKLNLTPHPEGGYFKEVYQAKGEYELAEGKRKYFTSIYFLLTPETKSHLHRLNHDEVWYYHDGASLKIHCLYPDGWAKIWLMVSNYRLMCLPVLFLVQS